MSTAPTCPLCHTTQTRWFHQDTRPRALLRDFYRCSVCDLTFVPKAFHINASAEKAIYDHHQNDPHDVGYRRFLSRLTQPIFERLEPGSKGLDFGCGPGPTIAVMSQEAGFSCTNYDLYYHPDTSALQQHYDFITSTEVFEHLSAPATVIDTLLQCLKPGGWLGLMTKRTPDDEHFPQWHYTLDPTHITFYSDATCRWIAQHYQLELTIMSDDTLLLRKP
ncbi:hypothetical protein BFW38_13605 [Terasakiispira papahanaumokuakeensis]|uniref:2-polyprenyl-3-methyl-5-hydroxy-6-metoxy-1, 4-benzoquinol methylase n=1 Tax=Terasakiispira papahanaumokuakeensis TaxID=197479 RepID=A0A1E2VC40_9GAMM|nr:class I SAM-dependent methyltransferase [Terasakiispira papahanaumokuakeensis]ODC04412.1 hypothetical protein BFW38_13605 [Terasakiispira papahanaumokuakeensis]